MAEELKKKQGGFKVWRNPSNPNDPIVYLGEYLPPDGSFFFTSKDLRELGFGPGTYTTLAPEGDFVPKLFSRWQKVTVPK